MVKLTQIMDYIEKVQSYYFSTQGPEINGTEGPKLQSGSKS